MTRTTQSKLLQPGLMQERPLLISDIIAYAARWHGDTEVVCGNQSGLSDRSNYREIERRSKSLAHSLITDLDVSPGDRIATLAWNTQQHLELFYAVSGIGAILHTVNPRLFPEQISYIVRHAQDTVVFLEPDFVPLMERLARDLDCVKQWVVLGRELDIPDTSALPDATYFDSLLVDSDPEFDWPVFDERCASSLCYTSGTTGDPKGVLYSHRSTVLHAMAAAAPGAYGVSAADSIMPIANMYHANAWALPYVAPLVGAKLVLPGIQPDTNRLIALMRDEGVSFTTGVPTVWTMILDELGRNPVDLPELRTIMIGGAALPSSMADKLRQTLNTEVRHAWGMTETSPLGVLATPVRALSALSAPEKQRVLSKQGRPPFGVDIKIVNDVGDRLPHDGKTPGSLLIKGHWICGGYFRRDTDNTLDSEGYFQTGDVGTIDALGYMSITDRTKDIIKSGGEWISSIELENIVMGMSEIQSAAAIGLPHPKWDERPILLYVAAPNKAVSADAIRDYLATRIAKWQLPDDFISIEEMPLTATGKISKLALRTKFKDHFALEPSVK